jgi:hypothetical protein
MRPNGQFKTYQYYALFLLSRIMAALCYVNLYDQKEAQFVILSLFQICIVAYVVMQKPYHEKYMQILNLVEECILLG